MMRKHGGRLVSTRRVLRQRQLQRNRLPRFVVTEGAIAALNVFAAFLRGARESSALGP